MTSEPQVPDAPKAQVSRNGFDRAAGTCPEWILWIIIFLSQVPGVGFRLVLRLPEDFHNWTTLPGYFALLLPAGGCVLFLLAGLSFLTACSTPDGKSFGWKVLRYALVDILILIGIILAALLQSLGFLVFALAFIAILTMLVRFSGMRVRSELLYAKAIVLTALFVGVVILLWWFLTRGEQSERIVQPLILPSPMEVLKSFGPLHFEQGLVRSAIASWLRVTTGFALAAIVAVPLGIYMATFPSIAAFFRPLALAGAYVPIVVFIPLSLTWFGTGETQKVGFLFIGCFVALLPLVIKDIADVPAAFLDVAATKGASQWQLVRYVLFPVAQGSIWDHLRGVYGVGWGWIIMAEVYVRPPYGLGALISVSERRSQTASIFAVIVVIVLIAVACDQLWRLGGNLLFPYRRKG